MYDSNLTIDIDSTTNTTYHGTVVIATQNVSETSIGSAHTITVYDDPTGTISDAIRVVWTSGSRNYNVYFAPATWSKNLIHIRALGNYLENIDNSKICTQFTNGTAPTTTSGLTVVNALKDTFAAKSHGTHVSYGISATAVGATASAGSATTVSRSDHVHSLPAATSSALGGVKIGSNITVSSGTISLSKTNVTNALGYTPPTTNTTYGVVSTSADGLAPKRDGSTTKFLRADGTWAVPPDNNTVYTHPTSGVTAGTYDSVTVDANGHVTAGSSPTQAVNKGGTGKTSWTANRLIYPSASTTMSQLAFPSVAGSVLRQGTSGAPYWTSLADLKTALDAESTVPGMELIAHHSGTAYMKNGTNTGSVGKYVALSVLSDGDINKIIDSGYRWIFIDILFPTAVVAANAENNNSSSSIQISFINSGTTASGYILGYFSGEGSTSGWTYTNARMASNLCSGSFNYSHSYDSQGSLYTGLTYILTPYYTNTTTYSRNGTTLIGRGINSIYAYASNRNYINVDKCYFTYDIKWYGSH